MDPDYDPAAGFARAAQTMAETQQILADTNRRIEATQRLGLRLQGFALALLGLALVGLGFLIWLGVTQSQEHAVHTQALLELVRRSAGR
jgi:predicted anti-sigma-YlaC factor YlaD